MGRPAGRKSRSAGCGLGTEGRKQGDGVRHPSRRHPELGGGVSLEQEANSREFKRKDSAEDGVGLTSA